MGMILSKLHESWRAGVSLWCVASCIDCASLTNRCAVLRCMRAGIKRLLREFNCETHRLALRYFA